MLPRGSRAGQARPFAARSVLLLALVLAVGLGTLAPHAAAPVASGMGAAQEGEPGDPSEPSIKRRLVSDGFALPTAIAAPHDGSGRLFVAEKGGRIRLVRDGHALDRPFLDLQAEVTSPTVRLTTLSKQGVLGLAFHPRFAANGYVYVFHTDPAGNSVLARYQVTGDPDVADPTTRKVILFQPQEHFEHYGGHLAFGPDGYLWVALGDGGRGNGERSDGAQDGRSWLGKMLRIDVDGGDPYAIPADNPYVGVAGHLPEIWALGLRNPWRWSFDRLTGDLWIADVGLNKWEEVNVVPSNQRGGYNFGWNILEGPACALGAPECDPTGMVMPVAAYGRDEGCSITGGYVYRGSAFPSLHGNYYYADFCQGTVIALIRDEEGGLHATPVRSTRGLISAFGEDEAGEIYFTTLRENALYRLVLSIGDELVTAGE